MIELGILADDLTGGMMVASLLEREGVNCPLVTSVEELESVANLNATAVVVARKINNLGKAIDVLILSRGLSLMKIPLWYLMHGVISFFLLQCNANRSFCPYKAHTRMKRTLGLLRNRNVFLARCSTTTSNEAVVWDARVDGEKRPSMQLV